MIALLNKHEFFFPFTFQYISTFGKDGIRNGMKKKGFKEKERIKT